MVKIYFVCMGNYYRSRLAEELARHYAAMYGVEIEADSGGLSQFPNPNNPGPIAKGTLQYLEHMKVQPRGAARLPKACNKEDIYAADIVVCTDADEQRELFLRSFPGYSGELICWGARDIQYDQFLETPDMINKHVEALIKSLAEKV